MSTLTHRSTSFKRKRSQAGQCPQCGSLSDRRNVNGCASNCSTCQANYKAWRRARVKYRKSEGLCVNCETPVEPERVEAGRCSCGHCASIRLIKAHARRNPITV